jgi:hypothetical protein
MTFEEWCELARKEIFTKIMLGNDQINDNDNNQKDKMKMTVSELKRALIELENKGKGHYDIFVDTFYWGGNGEKNLDGIDVLDIDTSIELNLR